MPVIPLMRHVSPVSRAQPSPACVVTRDAASADVRRLFAPQPGLLGGVRYFRPCVPLRAACCAATHVLTPLIYE
jgi:hypothetical protein